jgi:hypothetical protein
MDRFTHNRLRDEAILRAQERASLRKHAHPISPSHRFQSIDAGPDAHPKPPVWR